MKRTFLALTTLAIVGGALFGESGDTDAEPASPAQRIQISENKISRLPSDKTILTVARNFLTNKNQKLVTGFAIENTRDSQNISEFTTQRMIDRSSRENSALRVRSARLADLGERYIDVKTEVRLLGTQISAGTLTARIEETTRLTYDRVRGDEPPYTMFQVEREFTFLKKDGAWVVDNVHLVNLEGLAPINEVEEEPDAPADMMVSQPAYPPSEASLDASQFQRSPVISKASRSPIDPGMDPYKAMANYARTYAKSYNTAYRSFREDCTNFISQAMYAGGWTKVTGYYTSNDVWWYNWANQSRTWVNAHNWYLFATRSGRTYILSNVWDMQLADVLQFDWERDGNINHSMIVTIVGSSGERYLSGHTNNTLDRSLTSIIAQYPNAWYYAHRT